LAFTFHQIINQLLHFDLFLMQTALIDEY